MAVKLNHIEHPELHRRGDYPEQEAWYSFTAEEKDSMRSLSSVLRRAMHKVYNYGEEQSVRLEPELQRAYDAARKEQEAQQAPGTRR